MLGRDLIKIRLSIKPLECIRLCLLGALGKYFILDVVIHALRMIISGNSIAISKRDISTHIVGATLRSGHANSVIEVFIVNITASPDYDAQHVVQLIQNPLA